MNIIKEGKTNWKYIGIVIFLALIATGAVFIYQKDMIQEMTTPLKFHEINKSEEAEDETADWKTYINEEYGFELKYPENWEIEKGIMTPQPVVAFSPPSKGCFIIDIIEVPKEKELKDYLKELDGQKKFNFGNQKEIELLEIPAIQREEYFRYFQTMLTTYIKKGSLIFKFNFCSTLSPAMAGVTEEDRRLNNQMLSTFRFIEEEKVDKAQKEEVIPIDIINSEAKLSEYLIEKLLLESDTKIELIKGQSDRDQDKEIIVFFASSSRDMVKRGIIAQVNEEGFFIANFESDPCYCFSVGARSKKFIREEPELIITDFSPLTGSCVGADTMSIYKIVNDEFRLVWSGNSYFASGGNPGTVERVDIRFEDINGNGNLEIIAEGVKKTCDACLECEGKVLTEERIDQTFKWDEQKQAFVEITE